MIEGLRAGELVRFEALIEVVGRAARARERGPFALYVLDLGDAGALRFARATRAPQVRPCTMHSRTSG